MGDLSRGKTKNKNTQRQLLGQVVRAGSFSSREIIKNDNDNNNEILIKREPLVYTRALRAVQKNKKYNLG